MIKVNCPTCGVRLTAPGELLGKPVNCQKCRTTFVLSRRWMNEPLSVAAETATSSRESESVGRSVLEDTNLFLLGQSASDASSEILLSTQDQGSNSDENASNGDESPGVSVTLLPSAPSRSPLASVSGASPVASEPIVHAFSKNAADVTTNSPEPTTAELSSLRLGLFTEAVSWWDFFDFRFRRYLTPQVLRTSWFLILLVATCWILVLSYFFVSSLMQRREFALPEFRNRPFDASTTADVDVENSGESGLPTGSGGMTGRSERTETILVPQFFFNAAVYLTYVVLTIVGLLWTRVVFETMLMVFHIGSHLRSSKQFRARQK